MFKIKPTFLPYGLTDLPIEIRAQRAESFSEKNPSGSKHPVPTMQTKRKSHALLTVLFKVQKRETAV